MHIRDMEESDIERIIEITNEGWGEMTVYKLLEDRYGVIGTRDWRTRKVNDVRSFCQTNPSHVIVAVDNGTLLGYAAFSMNKEDSTGYVLNNAVDPSFRGKGIGTAMNRWIVDHFRNEGLRIACVSTLEHDVAAQRVYEKQGFKEVARSIHYSMRL